jgi:hypothetical protein
LVNPSNRVTVEVPKAPAHVRVKAESATILVKGLVKCRGIAVDEGRGPAPLELNTSPSVEELSVSIVEEAVDNCELATELIAVDEGIEMAAAELDSSPGVEELFVFAVEEGIGPVALPDNCELIAEVVTVVVSMLKEGRRSAVLEVEISSLAEELFEPVSVEAVDPKEPAALELLYPGETAALEVLAPQRIAVIEVLGPDETAAELLYPDVVPELVVHPGGSIVKMGE